MSFDIHNALNSVKLYGILLSIVFVLCVLQPQKFVSLMIASESAGAWAAHIGADLGWNILAVLIVTGAAFWFDVFGARAPFGGGSRDLGGPRR
jgi:hypothetical protein